MCGCRSRAGFLLSCLLLLSGMGVASSAWAQSGGLVIESQPAGAEVLINGKTIRGTTPMTIQPLYPGQYVVDLRKDGAHYTVTVTVWAGQLTRLTPVLQVARSRLELRSVPSGANVVFDGKAAGQTPRVFEDLLPGRYVAQLSKPGWLAVRRTVQIKRLGEQRTVIVRLEQSGTIEARSDPPGAAVFVDGVEMAATPVRVEVPAGEHTIKLSGPGRPDEVRVVQVAPGQTTLIDVRMSETVAEREAWIQSEERRQDRSRGRIGRSILAYATLTAGLGLVGGATAMYLLGVRQGNDGLKAYRRSADQADLEHWSAEVEDARTKLKIGHVLAGSGALLLALGIYQVLNIPEAGQPEVRPRNLALVPTAGGALLSLGARF